MIDATAVGTAFKGFRDLWCQAAWRGELRQVVHWYVASNTNAAAMEGSLVLAHAALERVAWTHLVVQGSEPSKAFDKLGAGRRIEALLSSLSIGASLPSIGIPDLASWALTHGWNTGPWAISNVRDMQIHPRRQAALGPPSRQVRIQATRLALWYLEISLLALCHYDGSYVNRLHPGPSVFDATDRVPWAPGSPVA